jgi:predicted Zn-dependent peptidase
MKFHKTKLNNGLRIITVPTPGNPSVTVLTMVNTGSNHESREENGLSHFLEHMCFKGTPTRPSALDVSVELDGLGAESNAFTYYEYTGYYAKGSKKHFRKLLDVVSDLYLNPTIPAPELEKERGVILQEISMYEDLPQKKVHDVFAELLHGDTPAGRSILGVPANIKRFSREDFLKYKNKHYVASGTIVVVAGDISRKEAEAAVKKAFENISSTKKPGKPRVKAKQAEPALKVLEKKTDQTHMVLGFRGFPAKDKRGPALELLAGVLGGGMSSRLFQKLREELGACYYVRTGNYQFSDYGFISIATGVEKDRVLEVLDALTSECRRIKSEIVSEKELNKTKDYVIGNLYMGLETTDALAGHFASEEVAHGNPKSVRDLEREIRKVSAKDIQKVAREVFKDKNLNLAIVGRTPAPAHIRNKLGVE